MSGAPQPAAALPAPGPGALLEALRASAGSLVEGVAPGTWDDAPRTDGLTPPRAAGVLAAWTGARLHAGAPGLLVATDSDVALLVGDWCFAHSLQALAAAGDLDAIGRLATAIGACATALTDRAEAPGAPLERLAAIWASTTDGLRAE